MPIVMALWIFLNSSACSISGANRQVRAASHAPDCPSTIQDHILTLHILILLNVTVQGSYEVFFPHPVNANVIQQAFSLMAQCMVAYDQDRSRCAAPVESAGHDHVTTVVAAGCRAIRGKLLTHTALGRLLDINELNAFFRDQLPETVASGERRACRRRRRGFRVQGLGSRV